MSGYVKPRSVTFWAGAASLGAGGLLGAHEVIGLGVAGDLLRVWIGPNMGPHSLITMGLGLIGLRKAIAP